MPAKKNGKSVLPLLFYHVPGFILLCFKRPKVDIHQYLEFSLKILWHPPRIPADTTSSIFKVA